ncbi:MAG TPA: Ig-like domain-containing protein, partial [Flavitalea sp.]|nr:Ig-like domain-containing protein [Flavitalea sp.]
MSNIFMRLGAIFFLLYAMLPATAQVVSGNGFLKGNYVEAGIQSNGSFGSSVSAPADFAASSVSKYGGRVGFIADVGKDGWTTGSPAYIGDFFLPGSPYEAFSVKINGTLYENQGGGGGSVPGAVTGFSSDGSASSVEWLGEVGNIQIRQVATIGKNKSYILIRATLKNTGSSTVNNIFYTRSVDPDNEVDQGGSFDTRNTIEEQNPSATSTALVSGKGISHNSYLGLGTRDCRARVAIMSSFSSDGEQIFNGNGQVHLKNKGATEVDDKAIAVAFKIGNLAAGDSTTVAMAYVLNASDLPPAMDETDPLFNVRADSYASGSVIDVCSGSTAQLNIINGDGYEWTWSPATGLNQTTGRSVEAILTGDITYTASGLNTCGTSRSITLSLHPVVASSPGAAGEISGTASVAKGWHATFSVPEIEDAASYKWSLPPGATFVSGYGTNSIAVKFGAASTSGAVTVYGENSCGNGAASSFNVTVAAGSALDVSSSNAGVAAGLTFADTSIIDDGITIIGSSPVTDARVYIDEGLQAGDKLIYDGELPSGITVSYSASTGVLSFTGTATPAEWKDIFKAVKFSTTSSGTADRTIKFILGSMLSFTIDGKPHFYEYVLPPAYPSWQQAYDAANGKTFFGLLGYLATITSAEENDFIKLKLSSDGWVGGSDAFAKINEVKGTSHTDQSQTEGNWYWVNGPEAGNLISSGNNSPVVASGGFMNWAPGEPNNSGNENYMQLYSSNNGKWNDLNGSPASVPGYVVEYGGYPSDHTINITYSRTIKSKPSAPVITGITDDTGLSDDDFITSDKTIKFTGTASPNSTVQVTRIGSGIIGTVTADGSGRWEYDYSGSALPDGHYSFNAVASANGMSSNASNTIVVNIDATSPVKPATPSLKSGAVAYTSEEEPEFTGTTEPGATVKVYNGADLLATVVADEDGKWIFTPPTALPEADYAITAIATDSAGNSSVSSDLFSVTVDRTAPATPSSPVMTGVDGDHTNDNTPLLEGNAEPNAVIKIYDGSDLVASIPADADGKWSYTFDPSLSDGAYDIAVTATDAAGNTSETSSPLHFVVDTQKPSAPNETTLDEGRNGYINSASPSISGNAEPGTEITVYVNDVPVGVAIVDEDGKWTYSFTDLEDGEYEIQTTATDAAGNISDKEEPMHFHVDTQTPAAPGPVEFENDLLGGFFKINKPTAKGQTEPGATVTIYDNGLAVATVTADEEGYWNYTFDPALAEGEHPILITVTDLAGNTSLPGQSYPIVIDTHAPAVSITSDKQKAVGPFTATITFTEPVSDFTIAGITVSNGSVSNFVAVSPTEYTVLVTPLHDNQNVGLNVAANTAFDASGNGNTASGGVSLKTEFQGIVEEVYPNPASNVLNVRFKGVTPVKGRVMLVKMTGQIVYDQQVNFQGNTLSIDVSKFSSGHYGLIIKAKTFT